MENNGRLITGDGSPEQKKHVIFLVLCALVTLLVYANSAFNGFVWDDKNIIINNPINRELANISQVLFSPDIVYQGDPVSYYRPLNRLSYMIDYYFFGLNPIFYHIENICIHLSNVILLYMVSLSLFKKEDSAFVTAVLFYVHPINAEAVNFISGRNNLLSVFFVLASLLIHLYGQENRRKSYRYLAAMFFFLGLLCKETAAMLFFVIFFFQFGAFSDFKETFKNKLVALAPFALSMVVYLAMRQKALSGLIWIDHGEMEFWQRISQNLYILPKYLSILFFPANLNAHYTIPNDYLVHGAWMITAWIGLVALIAVIAKFSRSAGIFGLLWFGINLIPISNIVPIPSAPMAERYMYLPAIGLWIIAGQCYSILSSKPQIRKPLIVGMVLLVGVFGTLTFIRNTAWKDDASLFSSMIKAEPNTAYGYYGLGVDFQYRGDLVQAKRLWEKALDIEPRNSLALNQIGNIYLMQSMLTKAEQYYTLATQADPKNIEAQYNLAMTLESLGKPDQAIIRYEMFLKMVTPEYSILVPKITARILQLNKKVQPTGSGKTP